jgi:hypothetical protein
MKVLPALVSLCLLLPMEEIIHYPIRERERERERRNKKNLIH